jgi:hypothetical protein
MKKLIFAAAMALISTATAFANEDNIIWVKAEAYPTGAGTVYTDFVSYDEKEYDATSEFKRYTNGAISDAFIWAQATEGYMLAGYARDNGNQTYDRDLDLQVKVRADGYFTAIYDPTIYKGNSSTEADELAAEALEQLAAPTDYIFAVFTKGVVARVAEDQIGCGNAYADKLYTEPGDQVTLSAYGDSMSPEGGGVKYYKFDHWTDSDGNIVSTEREMTVTVSGPAIYYAHFAETDKDDYKASENDPHKSEHYYDGGIGGATAIQHVSLPTQQDNRVYDLQGRYVANPTHGIFIQNGKKIVVR